MSLVIIPDQAGYLGYRLIGIQQIMNRHSHAVIEQIIKYSRLERLLETGFQRTLVRPDTQSQITH